MYSALDNQIKSTSSDTIVNNMAAFSLQRPHFTSWLSSSEYDYCLLNKTHHLISHLAISTAPFRTFHNKQLSLYQMTPINNLLFCNELLQHRVSNSLFIYNLSISFIIERHTLQRCRQGERYILYLKWTVEILKYNISHFTSHGLIHLHFVFYMKSYHWLKFHQ